MTSPQASLNPARGDDRGSTLGALELASCRSLEFAQVVWAEVGKRMPLEPSPEEFDRIKFGCIAWQEVQLDAVLCGGHIVAHQVAAMRPGAVPDDKQRTAQVSQQGFEELYYLLLGDAAIVQTKATAGEVHAGDERKLMPVEMKLHHWGLALQRPSAHPRWPLRDTGLVDEYDQPSLACGVFFSAGQVRLRQFSMAAASRSRARRSGFWLDKPNCPSKRQTWTSL